MQVKVLYFGVLKDALQCDREQFDLTGPASVDSLVSQIQARQTTHYLPWNSLAIAVNQVYARRDHVLHDGDEVALLPPVSGGSSVCEPAA